RRGARRGVHVLLLRFWLGGWVERNRNPWMGFAARYAAQPILRREAPCVALPQSRKKFFSKPAEPNHKEHVHPLSDAAPIPPSPPQTRRAHVCTPLTAQPPTPSSP